MITALVLAWVLGIVGALVVALLTLSLLAIEATMAFLDWLVPNASGAGRQ